MNQDKEVKIINPQALSSLGVFIIIPIGENETSVFYEAESLEAMENSFESLLESMSNAHDMDSYLIAKNQAVSLLDALAKRTAEKLLKLPQETWQGKLEKETKKLSKLKGFDESYFTAKVIALIH